MNNATRTLAIAITALRHSLGLTQRELSAKLNLSRSAITKIERGKGNPRISTLHLYSGWSGVPLSVLTMDARDIEAIASKVDVLNTVVASEVEEGNLNLLSSIAAERKAARNVLYELADSLQLKGSERRSFIVGSHIHPLYGGIVACLYHQQKENVCST